MSSPSTNPELRVSNGHPGSPAETAHTHSCVFRLGRVCSVWPPQAGGSVGHLLLGPPSLLLRLLPLQSQLPTLMNHCNRSEPWYHCVLSPENPGGPLSLRVVLGTWELPLPLFSGTSGGREAAAWRRHGLWPS